ncbi:MAG: PolC-type DNA polymerase III, partial [Propionicimonas sp.]
DLETNGFNYRDDNIIEVGVVVLDANFNEVDRYETLVKPPPRPKQPGQELTREERLDTGAVHIHGISTDDVRDARDFDEICFELRDKLNGRCLVAHNAPFELGHLKDSFRKAGVNPGWTGVLDTLRIARRHMTDLPNARLATVCDSLGVDYTNGHRALHDASVTVQALQQMNRRLHPHPVVL